MKLTSVKYNPSDEEWKDTSYLPSNSRRILVYSPEFGTSIGYYYNSMFNDELRIDEKVGIIYWRELPRYVQH